MIKSNATIMEKDLGHPHLIEVWMGYVEWPTRETLADNNFWLWRRRIRGTKEIRVTSRVFKPDVKPDKIKQPRFLCHAE